MALNIAARMSAFVAEITLTLRRAVLRRRRPNVALQQGITDCGYVCMSALYAAAGHRFSTANIKARVGTTSRGLTVRQLRDALRACGASATAVMFDPKRAMSFPCPGIILLKGGHYIAVVSKSEKTMEVFYPERGWSFVESRRLASQATGLAIAVSALAPPEASAQPAIKWSRRLNSLELAALKAMTSRKGVLVLLVALLAQALMLGLPLLSSKSIDAVGLGKGLGLAASAGLAYLLISLIGSLSTIFGQFQNSLLEKRINIAVAGDLFDRLAAKGSAWFESKPISHPYEQIMLCSSQLGFFCRLNLALIRVALGLAAGVIALFFVSPWLALPGLISMMLAVGIDLAYSRALSKSTTRQLLAHQRHRSFVLDVVSQIPLLHRFGSLWSVRAVFRRRTRDIADADLNNAAINSSRESIVTSMRSVEQLTFVCMTAYFMQTDAFSLGAFVAVGAYKDHLASALKSLFDQFQQYKLLEPHRLEVQELLEQPPAAYSKAQPITQGGTVISNVAFSYGEHDPIILQGASFKIQPGQCVVLTGPSGAGKTTLAKMIGGLISPTAGSVLIDGVPAAMCCESIGAVMQSDRLILNSIRENVRLYRKGISDEQIFEALTLADLDTFVRSLPMRLDTVVGEGQAGLSGGQRQRILLARALAGAPNLLVLDEATSGLEVEGEARILRKLKATGKTIVMCAHRPEVWQWADAVYRVDNQRVETVATAMEANHG
ncbi:peptidase domain-containing ABC transporter [Massilia sp. CF038]|uniref:peptidase domain-containing ABC transporter n=1 Tax=Massilia sp. CF038 TaxID=1881045 RepID=UPI000919F260|nr:ATP-binding cassette domain-containing protein [Massilia sp. CF038]SHH62675.1 ABC-type bacteriocin/lantibiotic exporter, contains an N-terminal double-glycine peptidase domain [Massilia sp. CF038]